jgi:hypothetical protein
MQNPIIRLSFATIRNGLGAAWNAVLAFRIRKAAAPLRKLNIPGVLSKETHWQRATSIVEQSLSRVTDIMANQAAASRQINAAEYALHSLLIELGSVMATGVRSPLEARHAHSPSPARLPSAMAA